jgi:multidrug resistance efflux pump
MFQPSLKLFSNAKKIVFDIANADFTSKRFRNSSLIHSVKGDGYSKVIKVFSYGVAGILAVLMLTAALPPLVADQSDRAVVNAPISLLTAPIAGNIDTMHVHAGQSIERGAVVATISNARVDRTTLIQLEGKMAETRERSLSAQRKYESNLNYLNTLDRAIATESEQLTNVFNQQIIELKAKLSASISSGLEKKSIIDRQTELVSRNVASAQILRPSEQQYKTALFQKDAETAKLNQKTIQLEALSKGVFIGDELVGLATLAQKKRDVSFDAERLKIEHNELDASLADQQNLLEAERKRLVSLSGMSVEAQSRGDVLNVGASVGRHVNAGDALASLVHCQDAFVVAIFSYRQGQNLGVGSRLRIDGNEGFGQRYGTVREILPKTNDKTDQQYAVPFPQTERRELYVLITPDPATDRQSSKQARLPGAACNVGQWVTVTRVNGWVPSSSVVWRSISETIVGALGAGPARAAALASPAVDR